MELRAYYFGNMYLSSIQQGIQAAHVTAEMFAKYQPNIEECDTPSDQYSVLTEWAEDHKVMILLNGGYASELENLVDMFHELANPFPFAFFRESQEAMQQCITSVGIVLPEYIWEGARQIREHPDALRHIRELGRVSWDPSGDTSKPKETIDVSKWEFELICRLNNYGLAR